METATKASIQHSEGETIMTVARAFALVFGAVYVLVGILGFIRPLTDAPADGIIVTDTANLLGIFAINWFHNLAHLVIGIGGLALAARTSTARMYAQFVGVAYAVLFVLGLLTSNVLGILPLNTPDNLLHLVSAALALVVGFTAVGLQLLGAPRREIA
jgi:hypothetical protein